MCFAFSSFPKLWCPRVPRRGTYEWFCWLLCRVCRTCWLYKIAFLFFFSLWHRRHRCRRCHMLPSPTRHCSVIFSFPIVLRTFLACHSFTLFSFFRLNYTCLCVEQFGVYIFFFLFLVCSRRVCSIWIIINLKRGKYESAAPLSVYCTSIKYFSFLFASTFSSDDAQSIVPAKKIEIKMMHSIQIEAFVRSSMRRKST